MSAAQRALLFLVLLGAGAVAYAGQRRTVTTEGQGGAVGGTDWPSLDAWTWVPSLPALPTGISDQVWILANQIETEAKAITMNPTINPERNVSALLQAIAQAEGTANQADPYRVCFGYRHTIMSLRDHPAITGEWKGEKLPDAQCRAAGFSPGCVSTAAGKYQIIRPTWERLRSRLGLRDFGPASQDAAAVELLRETGALDRIRTGDLAGAVSLAKRTWASLPGAGYDQPERSLGYIQTAYLNAGGALA